LTGSSTPFADGRLAAGLAYANMCIRPNACGSAPTGSGRSVFNLWRNRMWHPFGKAALAGALAVVSVASLASAQAPPSPAGGGSVVVASPTYTFIPLEIAINKPAAEVWKRVGKYCAIGEWLQIP